MSQIRFKWLVLKGLPADNDGISFTLLENKFDQHNGSGFINIAVDAGRISGAFVESRIVTKIVTDPYGISQEIDFTDYFYVDFHLEKIGPNLHIFTVLNPPSSIKNIVNKLNSIFPGNLSFISKEIDLHKFLTLINSSEGFSGIRVDRLKVGNFILSETSKASLEIVSRKSAFDEIETLIGSKKFSLDKIKGKGSFQHKAFSFELMKSCLGTVSDDVYEAVKSVFLNNISDLEA